MKSVQFSYTERRLFSFKKALFLKTIEEGEEVTISGWTEKISGMVKRRNRGVLEQSSVNSRDERESDERGVSSKRT